MKRSTNRLITMTALALAVAFLNFQLGTLIQKADQIMAAEHSAAVAGNRKVSDSSPTQASIGIGQAFQKASSRSH